MIVLDTSVLLYAVGDDHPLRDPCRRIIDAIGDARLTATTTVEVLQEFTHVRSRRRSRLVAARRADDFARVLSPLVRPDERDLRRGLELYLEHPRLDAFDAVLAGTVVNRPHLTALVSADRAYSDVAGLDHLDPSDPAVLS